MELVEVSREEFWKALYADKRDIMPRPVGRFPYTSIFEEQGSQVLFGKIVAKMVAGKGLPVETYYLAK